ncbi:PcsB-like coiled-coil domain-containing protein, partial [Bacillus safensis]|uniref:PcsB-like coiled-coil domain-containing protein n=1 Tax=Bacillus safensis TaxID=561879 RepID=UPI003391B967
DIQVINERIEKRKAIFKDRIRSMQKSGGDLFPLVSPYCRSKHHRKTKNPQAVIIVNKICGLLLIIFTNKVININTTSLLIIIY